MTSRFPNGARFAFTILDDTDDTTVENGPPVYELLSSLGFRTTKTVWTFDSAPEDRGPYFAGETLENDEYLKWVDALAAQGFEIAFHNASMGSSVRTRTVEALRWLNDRYPGQPTLYCNHGQNRENLYWGRSRYTQWPFSALARRRDAALMDGHVEGSEYFWGDVASQTFRYVRGFALARLDCSEITPGRPFHDPRRPYVARWFNTADAPDLAAFNRLVTPASLDRLQRREGWTIVSTHLGKGFVHDGRVDPTFEATMRYLATLPGWFVPATTLLDHLADRLGTEPIDRVQRFRMELAHAVDRALSRARN